MSRRCPSTGGHRRPPLLPPRAAHDVPGSSTCGRGRGRATRPCDRQHAGRATDRAPTHAGGGTGVNGTGVDCAGGAELVAAGPPEPDDELGVECSCDCGAHGAHQAQFRFDSHKETMNRSF